MKDLIRVLSNTTSFLSSQTAKQKGDVPASNCHFNLPQLD
jgi:hypothetical protein